LDFNFGPLKRGVIVAALGIGSSRGSLNDK